MKRIPSDPEALDTHIHKHLYSGSRIAIVCKHQTFGKALK